MLLQALLAFPNGVIAMCSEPAGLVETSLNLGVMKLLPEGLTLRYSVRSCVDRELEKLIRRLTKGKLIRVPGAKHEIYRCGNDILRPYLNKVLGFYLER